MMTAVPARRLGIFRRRAGRVIRRTWLGLFRLHAFDTAAAMTFYFFLSLVPLLAFVGFILSRIALAQGVDAFVAPLFAVVPAHVARLVRDELQGMADSGGVAPLSVVGFVYLTSSGTHNLMDLLEVATGAPPRGWWHQRSIAVAWNVASVLFAVVLGWLIVVLGPYSPFANPRQDQLDASIRRRLIDFSLTSVEKALFAGLFLFLSVTALAIFFRIAVAHPKGIRRRVMPGAIAAVLLGVMVSYSFGIYVQTLATYAVYYGSLAAVAVLLIWLYLTSLAILVGAEINAQLEGLRPHFASEGTRSG